MTHKMYSISGEEYFEEIEEVVDDFVELMTKDELLVKEHIVTFYEGDVIDDRAGKYFDVSSMIENIWDGEPEYVPNGMVWPNWIQGGDQEDELFLSIQNHINKWADKYKLHPKILLPTNIKPIKVKIKLNEFDHDFEILTS